MPRSSDQQSDAQPAIPEIAFDHVSLAQRVLFRTGRAVENCVAAVASFHAQRVFLVSDAFASELSDSIAERVPVAARVGEVVQHVPAERALDAVALADSHRCDLIVSIGGGSSTGLAKIVARETGLPIIAVPTTFAGSEATDVWGITENGHKTTGVDRRVLPQVVVYDADLFTSLPLDLVVSSGLNAMAHAIDSFWGPRADPINAALATEALRVLSLGLRTINADPDDIRARERTLYGAYLAAVSFASAGSGLHHKIAHVLGGRFDLPHADMHAALLPYTTAFNLPYASEAAERLSAAFDGAPAALALFHLRSELHSPRSLAELGLARSDVTEAASLSLASIPPSNPRRVDQGDLEVLLLQAWAGDEIDEG
ncbi:maleylacetate reductase [Microbacterium sp. NPDC058062]|uniref:maleylacetate reductase n=1 Tax=Microbacterium sp. NPDC058062 TaxID=3346320 RepID=UPI0036DF27C5